MSETTKIEWADATFNPWIGCTKVSAGCANCYAEKTTRARVLRKQGQETWGKGAKRSRTSAANWRKPVMWNREAGAQGAADNYDGHAVIRPRIFPSLCDWLDDEVDVTWLYDFLILIYQTPNLDWLLLTKRPELFVRRLTEVMKHVENTKAPMDKAAQNLWSWILDWLTGEKIPEQILFGVSTENQKCADERIPELLKIPAKVRFLSAGPLLGPINLIPHFQTHGLDRRWPSKIHWVIYEGESGPGARPCNVQWISDGVKQCKEAGVPVFVKQLGSCVIDILDPEHLETCPLNWPRNTESEAIEPAGHKGEPMEILLDDAKGGDMSEWPRDLRVREFPKL